MSNATYDTAYIDKKRWITCLLQILIGTASSFVYVLSVFIGPLVELKGWDANEILFTFTVAMWVGSPSIIIGGKICSKIGPKKVICVAGLLYGLAIVVSAFVTSVAAFIVLQGVVASFFMFCISVATLDNIGTLYPDKRGAATGLVLAGMGIGSAVIAPLAQYITDNSSVVVSIVGQGVAYAVIMVVCGALIMEAPKGYKPAGWEPEKITETADTLNGNQQRGPDVGWMKMLKTPVFWIVFFALLLINIVGSMPISNGAYMTELALGVSGATAAWIFSAVTVSCAVGNYLGGWIADRIGTMKTLALVGALNMIFAAVAGTAGLNSLTVWGIALIVIGFDYGCLTTIMPVIAMNIFGEKNFGVNYGIIGLNAIVVNAIGPQITLMEDMRMGMLSAAVVALVGSLLALLGAKAVSNYIKKAWAERQEA